MALKATRGIPASGNLAPTEDDFEEHEPTAIYIGGPNLGIPVNDPISLGMTAADMAMVPEHDDTYVVDRDLMEKLAVCVAVDYPALLSGPTGSGKTSAVRALAYALKQPLARVNMNQQMKIRDLLGYRTIVSSGETGGHPVIEYVDGIVPNAIRNDYWLLIDEIDMAPPGVLVVLQALLENERRLTLAEAGGEVVKPRLPSPGKRNAEWIENPGAFRRFRLFATMNSRGQGDDAGIYAGVTPMNGATLNRFAMIRVEYDAHETEAEILREHTGMNITAANNLVQIASLTRGAQGQMECSSCISKRQLIAWGQIATAVWGDAPKKMPAGSASDDQARKALRLGWSMAIGDFLDDNDRAIFEGLFQRVLTFSANS